jgi:hypothetical protein
VVHRGEASATEGALRPRSSNRITAHLELLSCPTYVDPSPVAIDSGSYGPGPQLLTYIRFRYEI